MRSINVFPLPSCADPLIQQKSVAIVIDVLRATTVFTYAAYSGVRKIIPVREIEEAWQLKNNFQQVEVLLGGERQGLPIQGFDLGNSPQHYSSNKVFGKTLIFTTTNGTQAMYAARYASSICIASFLNASAVVEHCQHENNIVIICAGTNGRETEEDLLLAGCLTKRLCTQHQYRLNTNAEKVARHWHDPMSIAELKQHLRESVGGKNLLRLGLDADITFSAQQDTFDIVPLIDPLLFNDLHAF